MDSIGSPLFRSVSMTLENARTSKLTHPPIGRQTSMPPLNDKGDSREHTGSSPKSVRLHRFDSEDEIIKLPQILSQRSMNAEGQKRRWTWKLDSVSPVPLFYPIQEWNTLKVDDTSLDTIADRISEFLRLHSIETNYSNEEGYVRCRTNSRVEFSINIWKERGEMATTTALLIHVQYIRGCKMQFHIVRSQLWNAILDRSHTTWKRQNQNCRNIALCSTTAITQDEGLTPITLENALSLPESPLPHCREMLNSRMCFERHLGLELLAMLTDKTKTIPKAVEEARFAVLHDPELQNILQNYLSITLGEVDETVAADYYCEENHILALQILSQSLPIPSPQDGGDESGAMFNNWSTNKLFWDSVLKVLLSDIRQATVKPLEATLSAQCLAKLVESATADQVRSLLVGGDYSMTDLQESVRTALQFGIKRNASLEYETKHLFRQLETIANAS